MNKTWKRQVFRHTALYTAILMFSHTGGGGGGGGAGAGESIRYCNEQSKAARGKVGEFI
ncbi:pilus assembly protein PilC [Neisseria meningitidis]|nr:pilus assembly protein PilC [Neisseria meningitidis]CWS34275.1 pilus assembly protein PilC [Neisseria meningitidis]